MKLKEPEKKINPMKKIVGGIMKNILTFTTQASVGNHKMQAVLGRQKGDHDTDVHCVDLGNWGRELDTVVYSLFVSDVLFNNYSPKAR